nr:ATP-binding protein [Aquabacterium terrae]
MPAPTRSLFKRTLAVFIGAALAVWCALMINEVYYVKVVQARNGQAWNRVWAEHVLLQLRQGAGTTGLPALERLRAQEWQDMGYEPPTILLQVLRDGALIHQYASPDLGRRKPPDPAQQASDRDWLYVELALPEQKLRVRRWQEMPGDWHFGLEGLTYYSRPFFLSLPVLALTAWLVLRLGFRPLRRVGQQIAGRMPGNLTPLPPSPYVELAPVVDAVNALLARLREHQERERDFLLNAAHGLKTPLAVIQANADTLASDDAGRREAARQRLADGVGQAGHMVHQVLSLARSEADPLMLDRRPVDLVGLLRDRIVLAADLAQRRGIEIELLAPADCLLPLHRETMGSLIDNLLDNAVKYSPSGSRVVVELRADDDAVRIAVTDQGPGIPAALRTKVFERFYRPPDQDVPGSGLGLTIVQRAAAQHAAEVTLDDGFDGRGLRVEVRLARAARG